MAYNPLSAINSIYNLKGEWEKYNKAGDVNNKNVVAEKAQAYYKQLRDSGYADIADKLSKSNYAQAKVVKDFYSKQGKSPIRDYLYTAGQKHGISQEDIDKALSFDSTTGEVLLGGKNIGKPYSIVDGTSYWDTSTLDKEFSDYLNRSGTPTTLTGQAEKGLVGTGGKYDELWGRTGEHFNETKADALATPTGKSILDRYDALGIKAQGNEAAVGAANNSGNVDSYAAANALRQNAALRNMGEQTAIAAHSAKVANMGESISKAQSVLEGLGVEVSRIRNDDQTALNNQVSREVMQSQVTNTVPTSMATRDNPYFNADGTLKNENIDYSAVVTNAKAQLAKTTDAKAKADLQHTIDMATAARNYKITSNPVYAKYANTIAMSSPAPTAQAQAQAQAVSEADKDRAQQIALSLMSGTTKSTSSGGTTRKASSSSGGATPKSTNLTTAQVLAAFKAGIRTPEVVNAYNALYGTNEVATPSGKVEEGTTAEGQAEAAKEAEAAAAELQAKYEEVYENARSKTKKFLREHISGKSWDEDTLRQHLIDSSEEYDLSVKDIKAICGIYGWDGTWADDYKDAGWFGLGKGVVKK